MTRSRPLGRTAGSMPRTLLALTAFASAVALSACSDTEQPTGPTGPEVGDTASAPVGTSPVAVKFGVASGAGSSASLSASTRAFSVPSTGSLTISGSNGTLIIGDVHLIVSEFELEPADGRCDQGRCETFEAPPQFIALPLSGSSKLAVSQEVPAGVYDELEFEVEDVDPGDEADPARREAILELLATIRDQFPEWPRKASVAVSGSFAPDDLSGPVPFQVFLEAEIEVEREFDPPLVVDEDGASKVVTVGVDPAAWFTREDGTVVDLTRFDFDDTGETIEFELELERGFRPPVLGDTPAAAEAEFEGVVESVDVPGSTFTLRSGAVIRVNDDTRFDDGDDDESLGSLEALADAVDGGLPVRASGEGTIEATSPLTILAEEVEFERPDPEVEFRRPVDAVDVEASTVTLRGGTTVVLDGDTEIEDDGDFLTLEEVAAALEDGVDVRAEGEGTLSIQPGSGPPSILADEIKFEARSRDDDDEDDDEDDDDGDEGEFDGTVTEADPAASTLTLEDGTVVRLDENTEIDDDGDLFSVDEVAAALEAGTEVKAEGEGTLESGDPPTILASEIKIEAEGDADDDEDDEEDEGEAEFEGRVVSIDLDASTVTLTGGIVVRLDGETTIDEDGDLTSLQAVADALAAGTTVEAEGEGTLESVAPPTILASEVKFETDD